MNFYQFLLADFDILPMDNDDFFKELASKKILVTGATGFFGKWLLYFLIYLNREKKIPLEVLAISRNSERFLKNHPEIAGSGFIKWLDTDLRSELNSDFNPDFILHMATDVPQNGNVNLESFETITCGMRAILNFVKSKSNKKVKLLITSSGAVYGNQPSGMSHIEENYSGSPNVMVKGSFYGEAKRVSELMCTLFKSEHENFEFVSARCFAFSGPFLPLEHKYALGNFVKDIIDENDITVKSSGKDLRSYLYGADLVYWLLKILIDGRSGEAYNVGSEEAVSIGELAKLTGSFSSGNKVSILGQSRQDDVPGQYVPSVKKAATELGLKNNFQLKYAIGRMIQFNKEFINA